MKRRVSVVVKGVVQGVNFRYYTKRTADRLGVTGWVKNLPDGNVEGCFEGDEGNVEALVEWCRRGPDSAYVDDVAIRQEVYAGEFEGFHIIR